MKLTVSCTKMACSWDKLGKLTVVRFMKYPSSMPGPESRQ